MRYLSSATFTRISRRSTPCSLTPQAVGYDAVLCSGDLVGYGADPAAVIDRTLALEPVAIVRGNHDKVCAGLEPPLLFNDVARAVDRVDARRARRRAPGSVCGLRRARSS